MSCLGGSRPSQGAGLVLAGGWAACCQRVRPVALRPGRGSVSSDGSTRLSSRRADTRAGPSRQATVSHLTWLLAVREPPPGSRAAGAGSALELHCFGHSFV